MSDVSARKNRSDGTYSGEHDLVFLLGEELKKPLTAIKVMAEMNADSAVVSAEARRALRTVDNVLIYQRLVKDQLTLELEPVHIGSTMVQVTESIRPLANAFGCETEVIIGPGMIPVDADRYILTAAIESLWQAVLGLTKKPSPIVWEVKRGSVGTRIMVTNGSIDLTKVTFGKHATLGKSRQPFGGLAGPATDLLTAKGLFEGIGGTLRKYQTSQSAGFSVQLRNNPQLSLL